MIINKYLETNLIYALSYKKLLNKPNIFIVNDFQTDIFAQ